MKASSEDCAHPQDAWDLEHYVVNQGMFCLLCGCKIWSRK